MNDNPRPPDPQKLRFPRRFTAPTDPVNGPANPPDPEALAAQAAVQLKAKRAAERPTSTADPPTADPAQVISTGSGAFDNELGRRFDEELAAGEAAGLGIDALLSAMTQPQVGETDHDIPFFGTLGTLYLKVPWNGKLRNIGFHILSGAEELDLRDWVNQYEPHKQVALEAIGRMAMAVRSVSGMDVAVDFPEFEDRVQWIVKKWPGPLIDVVNIAYTIIRDIPIYLRNMRSADPNIDAEPTTDGSSSSGSAPGTSESSPPTSGPSRTSTSRRTGGTRSSRNGSRGRTSGA